MSQTQPLILPSLAVFAGHVADRTVLPAFCLDIDHPRSVEQIDVEWHRMSLEGGLFTETDPQFLVAVMPDDPDTDPAIGPGPRPWSWWARVRLLAGWDLVAATPGIISHGPGYPAFVVLSVDGTTSIRIDRGEATVDLVLVHGVDRIPRLRTQADSLAGGPTAPPRTLAAIQRWLVATAP